MAYVQSNPWVDAGNYGRGIGEALAQAFVNAPMQRQQLLQQMFSTLSQRNLQQERLGIQKQRVQGESDYHSGMIGAANKRNDISDENLQEKQRESDNRDKSNDLKMQGEDSSRNFNDLIKLGGLLINGLKATGLMSGPQHQSTGGPGLSTPLGQVPLGLAEKIGQGNKITNPLTGATTIQQSPISVAMSNLVNQPFQGGGQGAAPTPAIGQGIKVRHKVTGQTGTWFGPGLDTNQYDVVQ